MTVSTRLMSSSDASGAGMVTTCGICATAAIKRAVTSNASTLPAGAAPAGRRPPQNCPACRSRPRLWPRGHPPAWSRTRGSRCRSSPGCPAAVRCSARWLAGPLRQPCRVSRCRCPATGATCARASVAAARRSRAGRPAAPGRPSRGHCDALPGWPSSRCASARSRPGHGRC